MKRTGFWLGLILISVALASTAGYVLASPSEDFREVNGEIFDDWDICRTRAAGEDGFYQVLETTFRPVIAFESLGEGAAAACRLGEQTVGQYPDQIQRAEEIFWLVRDRVRYTPDIDQFRHEEFAQNADELAAAIDENGVSYGDCEDSAVLLAVMYRAAGYRSAIVVGSGHTAALVYLPGYSKAAAIFELDGEPGWIWAEATGRKNPLGWVPKEFLNVGLAAYEITEENVVSPEPVEAPRTAIAGTGKTSASVPFPFFGIIALLWLIPLFRRRRAR